MLRPELSEIDPLLRDMVEHELRPGERLVWARQPLPRWFSAGVAGTVLFAIPWTAFAVWWIFSALSTTSTTRSQGGTVAWLFPLWGVPFILIGLGMLSAPYWSRRALRRSVYLVTDGRAVVLRRTFFGSLSALSFEPDRLLQMERVERRDGSGDLIFETFTTRHGSGTSTTRHGFLSVADVRQVEDVVRRTLLQERARPL